MPRTTVVESGLDVVGEALRALRLRGTLLLREAHRSPFCVLVPARAEIEAVLEVPPGSGAVAFHLAERGSFDVRPEGHENVAVQEGGIVLGLAGGRHFLARGAAERTHTFAELLGAASRPLHGPVESDGDTDSTHIVCGALVFDHADLNPLLGSLPPYLYIAPPDGSSDSSREQLLAVLRREISRQDPASGYLVEKLLETLCAEGIRAHAAASGHSVGWFRGLSDSAVGRAIRAFHAAPGEGWTVARLATVAHLSPSRFAARFSEVTGTTTMGYVARWRMNLAMRALYETDRTVSQLASELGYDSAPAFSRTFKRLVGSSPMAYRRQRLAGPPTAS